MDNLSSDLILDVLPRLPGDMTSVLWLPWPITLDAAILPASAKSRVSDVAPPSDSCVHLPSASKELHRDFSIPTSTLALIVWYAGHQWQPHRSYTVGAKELSRLKLQWNNVHIGICTQPLHWVWLQLMYTIIKNPNCTVKVHTQKQIWVPTIPMHNPPMITRDLVSSLPP